MKTHVDVAETVSNRTQKHEETSEMIYCCNPLVIHIEPDSKVREANMGPTCPMWVP